MTGETPKRVVGKIIRVSDKGWGFIVSRAIPFTRIFFHWTSLNQETAHFTELQKGMEVEFTPIDVIGKGVRAIKIDVLESESEGITAESDGVKGTSEPITS